MCCVGCSLRAPRSAALVPLLSHAPVRHTVRERPPAPLPPVRPNVLLALHRPLPPAAALRTQEEVGCVRTVACAAAPRGVRGECCVERASVHAPPCRVCARAGPARVCLSCRDAALERRRAIESFAASAPAELAAAAAAAAHRAWPLAHARLPCARGHWARHGLSRDGSRGRERERTRGGKCACLCCRFTDAHQCHGRLGRCRCAVGHCAVFVCLCTEHCVRCRLCSMFVCEGNACLCARSSASTTARRRPCRPWP